MSFSTVNLSYYFDANALWKFYRDEKGDMNVRRLVARSPSQVLISPLTMLEFFGVLMKYYRQRLLKRKQVRAVAKRLRRDSTTGNVHRPFRMVQVLTDSFRQAQSILLQEASEYNIQANDALHLAILLALNTSDPVVLVTCDKSLQHTAQC
ncbi:MAG: type II toxin-antitoxin system VapC family toxin, partial [Chloroflexota bacterium]|nr:type II toxin-antitoxin system VapC family toxin [Chloroflexota bacterium]